MNRCTYCQRDFPSDKKRRKHPCPERDIARRAGQLRWPVEPVAKFLIARYGEYEVANPEGYCATTVERLTGVSRATWGKACREGGLTDETADRVAIALGAHHEWFWPDWHNALEVTDEDEAWYQAWSKGAA